MNGNRTAVYNPHHKYNGGYPLYDSQDRLVSYGDYRYEYTENGALSKKRDVNGTPFDQADDLITTYSYDHGGNLLKVNLPNNDEISYTSDALNRRIAKMKNGNYEYKLLYSGQLSPVARLDADDRVVEEYIYGTRVNVPEYMIKDGRKYRFITDHRGSVRMVVDTHTGTVMQRTDYDEFGLIIDEDLAENWEPVLFGYAGGLQDRDTGLIRFGARDYDPMVGRWTSKEPLGFNGASNFYVYAENDPVNKVDINGLDWLFFDGRELFWYNDNNNVVDSFAAVSGPFEKGAIADGIYEAYLSDNLGNEGLTTRTKKDSGMVCKGDDYGWSVNIDDPPGREHIRIHPDGNNFGTQGCIGVSCNNYDYLRLWGLFVDYSKNNKTIDLYVLKLYDRRSY